eukprot:TRINITY_DN8584_c0_g5_i1.p1 TRINITY_DN8584_c0_g5~~TRINITY_DN8584_c0_g5_i1.p1  ORF type:complete len:671 (+),score=285.30 TRINITY_DN8584_c0_g5_i1:100-2112(+)
MQRVAFGDAAHYDLTYGKQLPGWLSDRKQKNLGKKREDDRIELVQDLRIPQGSPHDITMTDDGQYLWLCGEYPAQLRCYDLSELSMKFKRHVDSAILRIAPLSADYRKVALLEQDRFVEVHAQGGRHARLRVPTEGRDMVFDQHACALYVSSSSSDVFRLDLDQGRFLDSVSTSAEANDCVAVCPAHPLLAVGGVHGRVECFDLRTAGGPVGTLDAAPLDADPLAADDASDESSSAAQDGEVRALCFDRSGMQLLVGTSGGNVGLYDLRKRSPLLTKRHNNSLPIQKLQFHSYWDTKHVISADQKGMKVWKVDGGDTVTTLNTSGVLSRFCVPTAQGRDSGLIFAATEAEHVNAFYVPSIGPAPQWCSYLESVTEGMEEDEHLQGQYDDFKFVTREEMERLGLAHLLTGRNKEQVRPYMHGFYVDLRLYRATKAVLDPGEYRDYQRQKRLDKKRAEDVITVGQKKRDFLKPVAPKESEDSRFATADPKFKIDEDSEAFLRYNPSKKGGVSSAFRPVEEENPDDDDGGSSGLSDAEDRHGWRPKEQPAAGRRKGFDMYELKEGREIMETAKEGHAGRKRERHKLLTMEERLAKREAQGSRASVRTVDGGAAREITFELKQPQKRRREEREEGDGGGGDADGGKRRRSAGKGKGKGGGKGGKGKGGGKGRKR